MSNFVVIIAAGAVVILMAVLILTILLVLGSILKNLEKWEQAVVDAMDELDDNVEARLTKKK